MGALPDRLPGFQHVENDALREQVRARLGRRGPAQARLAPVGHVRGDGPRRADRALRHRREPAAVRGRPARDRAPAEGPRPARRPGHLPDRDRRDRRRRASRPRPRGPRARARSRTPSGGSSGCARRSSRRARRATTCGSSSSSPRRLGPRLGRGRPPRRVWDEVRAAVAGPRRDELRAARGRGRPPVAVLRREPPGRAVPPLAPVGGPGARATGRRSCRSSTTRRSTSSTTTSRCG